MQRYTNHMYRMDITNNPNNNIIIVVKDRVGTKFYVNSVYNVSKYDKFTKQPLQDAINIRAFLCV